MDRRLPRLPARARADARIEATPAAQDEWVDYVNLVADITLFPTCNSWYLGANVPGKTRVFMPLPGFPLYAEQCEDVAPTATKASCSPRERAPASEP